MEPDELAAYEAFYNPKVRLPPPPRIDDVRSLLIYQDDDFLIFDKPAWVSTLDERAAGFGPGLVRLVKEAFPEAQAAHRLDKETSGCIAFALNREAYRHLAMQFEHRQVAKFYHAVSGGLHQLEPTRIALPITVHKGGYATIDKREGRPAETLVRTLRVYRKHTLFECRPVTGRLHQIRVHLAALKAPIVGDEQYGGEPALLSELKRNFKLKTGTVELPLIHRVALHAKALSFEGMNGDLIRAEAPYPKDMTTLITQLERYA